MPPLSPLVIGTAMLLIVLFAGSELAAQDSYDVGDKIRFQFMRKEVQGTVSEVFPGGMYKVDLDNRKDRFLPPFTLVQQSKVLGKVKPKSSRGNSGANKSDSGSDSMPDDQPMPESEPRTWHDKSGKFSIEATFVELKDGSITLKKTDGKTLTLDLEKLSPADIAFANSQQKSSSARNPFAGGQPAMGSNNRDNGKVEIFGAEDEIETNSVKFAVKEIDFSSTKIVTPGIASQWDVKPTQPVPVELPATLDLHPIEISGGRQVIRDTRTPNRVYIGNRNLRERTEEGLVIDLATGKTLGPFTYPMINVQTIAFDSKSNQLITATTVGERVRPKTVDVWRINGNEVEHMFGFVPSNKRIVLPVRSGVFLDESRVLLTIVGNAGIFNLKTMKAEAAFQFFAASKVNIGPNGKYLFGRVDDKTSIVEVASKKTIGSLDQVLQNTNNFGFNESMTRLALSESQRLVILDLTTGAKVNEVYLPTSIVVATTPVFLDDENVLLTRGIGASLINTRLKSPIWSFRGSRFYPIPGTKKILAVGDRLDREVAGFVDMPPKAAKDLIENLTLEELIVMPRGSSVSVRNIQSSARRSIKEQLEQHGYHVVENAPFEFRTKVTKGPTSQRTYRDVTGGADETVTLQSESYELALYHGEEKVWYRRGGGGGNDPGNFVQLNDGETVQSRVNKGKGSPQAFFGSLLIPDVFVKTPKGYYYGSSRNLDDFDHQ